NRLLLTYTADWKSKDSNSFAATYQLTNSFGVTSIPVYVNGQFVYGSGLHRVLQLVANLYDSTTNRNPLPPELSNGKTLFTPTVFRPQFTRDVNNNLFITNFVEVVDNTLSLPNNLAFLSSPFQIWDLGDSANRQKWISSQFRPNDSYYNVPLVI